nr:uncharacterized protein LOC128691048 [Cherax quadricarinatus]
MSNEENIKNRAGNTHASSKLPWRQRSTHASSKHLGGGRSSTVFTQRYLGGREAAQCSAQRYLGGREAAQCSAQSSLWRQRSSTVLKLKVPWRQRSSTVLSSKLPWRQRSRNSAQLKATLEAEKQHSAQPKATLEAEKQHSAQLKGTLEAEKQHSAQLKGTLEAEKQHSAQLKAELQLLKEQDSELNNDSLDVYVTLQKELLFVEDQLVIKSEECESLAANLTHLKSQVKTTEKNAAKYKRRFKKVHEMASSLIKENELQADHIKSLKKTVNFQRRKYLSLHQETEVLNVVNNNLRPHSLTTTQVLEETTKVNVQEQDNLEEEDAAEIKLDDLRRKKKQLRSSLMISGERRK